MVCLKSVWCKIVLCRSCLVWGRVGVKGFWYNRRLVLKILWCKWFLWKVPGSKIVCCRNCLMFNVCCFLQLGESLMRSVVSTEVRVKAGWCKRCLAIWFGSSHFGLNRLCVQIHFLVPCRPSMERTVLDWQGPRIAGFIDGTYVQLSLADWLRLGGHVEQAVEETTPNIHLVLLCRWGGDGSRKKGCTFATGTPTRPAQHRTRTNRVSPTRPSRSPTPLLHSVSHRPS